jgi:hypothetical protein
MSAIEVDTTCLPLLLQELRLPAGARLWPEFTERSDKEGWPAARLRSVLAELEIAERGRRRIERHLAEARLPPGKTLGNFDFATAPLLGKARVMALAAGDAWLDKASRLDAVTAWCGFITKAQLHGRRLQGGRRVGDLRAQMQGRSLRGWHDVAGLRGRSRATARGSAQTGPSRRLPASTVPPDVSTEGGRETSAAGDRRPGG